MLLICMSQQRTVMQGFQGHKGQVNNCIFTLQTKLWAIRRRGTIILGTSASLQTGNTEDCVTDPCSQKAEKVLVGTPFLNKMQIYPLFTEKCHLPLCMTGSVQPMVLKQMTRHLPCNGCAVVEHFLYSDLYFISPMDMHKICKEINRILQWLCTTIKVSILKCH